MNDRDHARITRRGQQIFQLALRMELGDVERGKGGAEALLYLADAIARLAALSEDPRLALETMGRLIDKIDDGWFVNNHTTEGLTPEAHLLADITVETVLGQDDGNTVDAGALAARALAHLTDAVVSVAALNSEPRRILEHVVQRLDATDVDAIRKEKL